MDDHVKDSKKSTIYQFRLFTTGICCRISLLLAEPAYLHWYHGKKLKTLNVFGLCVKIMNILSLD
jgi:hypothetical protein